MSKNLEKQEISPLIIIDKQKQFWFNYYSNKIFHSYIQLFTTLINEEKYDAAEELTHIIIDILKMKKYIYFQ